jgi:aerobic carbon-monoxide dehydrogenase large subunit
MFEPLASATGKRVRRVEDARFLTGTGRYVEDLAPAGMLHLALVRSPYPSARLTRIDVSRARAYPGVVAVATAADLARLGADARDAADLVEVEFEP